MCDQRGDRRWSHSIWYIDDTVRSKGRLVRIRRNDTSHVLHKSCRRRVVEDECCWHIHTRLLADACTKLDGTERVNAGIHQRLIETNTVTDYLTKSTLDHTTNLRCKHQRVGGERSEDGR